MKTHIEREWSMNIGADTVRMLAATAQAISANLNTEYEDGREHQREDEVDMPPEHHADALVEEETGDKRGEQFRQQVGDLNVDQAAELLAIVWIGRGDYEVGEWRRALEEARTRNRENLPDYLLEMPLLGDYLMGGLEAIGA